MELKYATVLVVDDEPTLSTFSANRWRKNVAVS